MRWPILILVVLLDYAARAQASTDQIVVVEPSETVVKTGANSIISIHVEVRDGYHIQANKVHDEYIVPTTLVFEEKDGFVISDIVFPTAKKFRLEGTDNVLDVYDGKFEIRARLNTHKQIKKGEYILAGKLNYQACDSVRCLFPREVKFEVQIKVR